MSSRTYLSIGDVLTLLREEFPDVTISKIRFLESQGLVNPERSPSGYRKFFDHDVERLRWVLRQQREHFLPLKVIRDRLADGDLGEDLGEERPNGKEAEPAHAVAVAGVTSGHAHEQPTKADEEAMARILADASRRAARLPEEKQARPGLQVVAEADAGSSVAAEPAAQREGVLTAPRRAAADRAGDAATSQSAGRKASTPTAATPTAATPTAATPTAATPTAATPTAATPTARARQRDGVAAPGGPAGEPARRAAAERRTRAQGRSEVERRHRRRTRRSTSPPW